MSELTDCDLTKIDYFNYLCNIVGIGNQERGSYYILAKRLYSKHFYYMVGNDINREDDGCHLRYSWWRKIGYADSKHCLDALHGPCTVFEMLVALAMRMEDNVLYDAEKGSRVDVWFFEMIKNLGLIEAVDQGATGEMGDAIDYAIETLLDRKYDRYGHNGGLFPVDKLSRGKDMRKMEIWFQMHAYIQEKGIT